MSITSRVACRALAPMLPAAILLYAAPLAAQSGTTGARSSAEISNARYEIAFDRASAATRTVRVTMRFSPAAGGAPVLLSLPAWTPGAYEITNFAHWVSGFSATADGRELTWDKADFDTWRVRPGSAREVTVRFDYLADTLDNAMSWTRDDFLLANGTQLFLYPEGQSLERYAATVTVTTEAGWLVATGMEYAGRPNTFRASNYHDLVDMPFFIGRFDMDSAQVAGKNMRIATYPAGSVAGAARTMLWNAVTKMVPPQTAVFGETPWNTYTIMQIAPASYGGGSGLEHQNSHVDIVTPRAIGTPFLDGLYAHEIFHAWNVKRLRPADLVPYRYDSPQPTTWLWVSEGITDYYADLSLVRGGLVDSAAFLETTAGKINEVAAVPPVALEDASLSTWIHPQDGTGYLYYPKGSLAGLMLDVLIRDASDNRRSLDDVMRELYQTTYKRGLGFTGAQWWAAVSRAAGGRSFTEEQRRYIDGRDEFPWATVLPLAGIRYVADTVREPRLGVNTGMDSGGVRVVAVAPGTASQAAGLLAGDYLVSVGVIAVKDQNWGMQFRARYGTSAGTVIPVIVRRDGKPVLLNLRVALMPRVDRTLSFDSGASAKAARVRHGILTGTTAK